MSQTTIAAPAGSMMAHLLDEELVGEPGEKKAPEGGVTYNVMSDAWAVWTALGCPSEDADSYGKYLAAAKVAHSNGRDPIKDDGILTAAMTLPKEEYERLEAAIVKMGNPKRRAVRRRS